MQEEEEKEAADAAPNGEGADEGFVCAVCYEEFDEHNCYPLETCDHVFHNDCLQQFLNNEISNSKFPIHCPDAGCK